MGDESSTHSANEACNKNFVSGKVKRQKPRLKRLTGENYIKASFKDVVRWILDQNNVATGNECSGVIKHTKFYVLLTVHIGIVLVNNRLDAQFFPVYVYFDTLHVSSNHVHIIRRINCINTTSGICHSM